MNYERMYNIIRVSLLKEMRKHNVSLGIVAQHKIIKEIIDSIKDES